MSLKHVKESIDEITNNLANTQEAREFLIRNARDVIILCSQSIIAVHKNELKDAKHKAAEAKKLLKEYRKRAKGELRRHLLVPEQELVEAHALIAIVDKKEIPSYKSLGVSEEAYVLGLLDCIGEMKRLIYDKIRRGDSKDASRVFECMEETYHTLYPLATFDKIVKETRRKLDVGRSLIEDARSALTEEIRRAELINSIRWAKKELQD